MRDTSLMVFREIQHKLGDMQQTVLVVINAYPNSTDLELCQKLGYTDPNRLRPRRKELLDYGWIVDMGVRECTVSHRKAHTWKVKPR
jgi:hypothetical protein